ncbi:hypothetical protein SKAU_G00212160 [Synaphobranchus kaupii]|uniref:Uncharacterized protein n=1 Tax=Synaphobranchus kaupii TaxID=118154 RepID=A0A9Q1F8Z4_SYNKA|nr:hypothetical protein SKAU_G00212150 [Synaphobranchus kaupii]KAJ8353649.1 hypothetical protein SKAU_G00212160 [Synaphobranchus kaupii]
MSQMLLPLWARWSRGDNEEDHELLPRKDDGVIQEGSIGPSQPPLMPVSAAAKAETQPLMDTDLPGVAPLPISSSPRASRTGPIKTGGLIQVLDHSRWTEPMRAAIDGLLIKYHEAKDLLKRVDADYAAMVQRACTDPNSLLHPTTRQHISRYVKHLAKLKNTSSSLNTSSEKVLETQQLWQSLTTGSQTVSVPVTTLPPATLNPPPATLNLRLPPRRSH